MNKNNHNDDSYSIIAAKWSLVSLSEDLYKEGTTNKHPTLEVSPVDDKIFGNDGCNRFFGKIINMDHDVIKFGPLAGTKMMCPNFEYSNRFQEMLGTVASYKFIEEQLVLYTTSGMELASFKKTE